MRQLIEISMRAACATLVIAAAYHSRNLWMPKKQDAVSRLLALTAQPSKSIEEHERILLLLPEDMLRSADKSRSAGVFYRQLSRWCCRGIRCSVIIASINHALTMTDMRALLVERGIVAHDVVSVNATVLNGELPTVSIIDSRARTTNSWVAPLSKSDQQSILQFIQSVALNEAILRAPKTSELASWSKMPDDRIVVDTRSRKEFRSLHIRGAINIPFDELAIRLKFEAPSDQRRLFFCGSQNEEPAGMAKCLMFFSIVGDESSVLIAQGLEELEDSGVSMIRE